MCHEANSISTPDGASPALCAGGLVRPYRGRRCPSCYWALYDGVFCQNRDCLRHGTSPGADAILLSNEEAAILISADPHAANAGQPTVLDLAHGSALSSVRTLRVLFWHSFFGEHVNRCVNIPSPLVSNQPDPSIQHASDCREVEAWRDAAMAPSGTAYLILGVLANVVVSNTGANTKT